MMESNKEVWNFYIMNSTDPTQLELDSQISIDVQDINSTLDGLETVLKYKRKSNSILVEWDNLKLYSIPDFLYDYVLFVAIDAGMVLRDKSGNEVNAENVHYFLHPNQNSDNNLWRSLSYLIHFERRIRQGIPANKVVPDSHIAIKNGEGDIIEIVPKPESYQKWIDLANLILKGTSWKDIANDMYEDFGYVNDEGKPYSSNYYYHLVFTPAFWGHSAHNFKNFRFQPWVYQQGQPVPDEVVVYYDTHESIWKGSLAERIKEELDRRMENAANNQLPDAHFHELMICGECANSLTMRVDGMWLVWVCKKHKNNSIRDRTLRKRLNTYLYQLISQTQIMDRITATQVNDKDIDENTHRIQVNLELIPIWIERIYERLIHEDTQALKSDYIQFLTFLYIEQERLQDSLTKFHRQMIFNGLRQYQPDDSLLEESWKKLWQLSGPTINELLQQLLGKNKLVILDGEVAGMSAE